MSSLPIDKIEESAHVLKHEIDKLDEIGLSFAASLVRIAHMDLQMRLCGVSEEEIDVLSFAMMAVEQEKAARLPKDAPQETPKRAVRSKRSGT